MEPEINSNKRTKAVYWGGFLLAIHYALIAYVNSSLLGQFVSNNQLDVLYIIGSILGITILSLAPFFLRKYGSLITFLFFVALEMLAIFGLGVANSKALVVTLFIIYLSADAILYFCLDINLEQETKAEGTTGSKRGAFLTIQNIAWILSPLALTFLITQNTFGRIYLLSGTALIPLFILAILYFRNVKETGVADSRIIPTLRSLRNGGDQARIIGVQFMLNFFYAWMMIYLPLLLNKQMGFSWPKIGVMFVIMLLPFLLIELPAGILSDRRFGEKEILTIGFLIMFLATLVIPFLTTTSFIIWSLVLFATRIGASLVEVGSETYFFKHVREENTGLISLFRMARPFAFIMVPLIALLVLHYFTYSASFLFLAFFTLIGLFFIPKIDTK